MGEKALCQVLRILFTGSSSTAEGVQGIPVRLSDLVPRRSTFVVAHVARAKNLAPVRCLEANLFRRYSIAHNSPYPIPPLRMFKMDKYQEKRKWPDEASQFSEFPNQIRYIQGKMVLLSIVDSTVPRTRILLGSRRDFDDVCVPWVVCGFQR